jgi:hypothetical protein
METEVIDKTKQDVTTPAASAASGAAPTDAAKPADAKAGDGAGGSGRSQSVEGILDRFGLESPEELGTFIENLAGLKDKLGDEDVEDLLAVKKQMLSYQAEWAKQEEASRREKETPEETIARLEKQNKDLVSMQSKREKAEKEQAQAKQLMASFNKTVTGALKEVKELPKYARSFMSQYYGVDNPMPDLDLTDKAGIKRLVAAGAKQFEALRTAIIDEYKSSGGPVPPMDPSTTSAPGQTGGKIKNMKDARRVAIANLHAKLTQR